MLTPSEADAAIAAALGPLGAVERPLAECAGCILRGEVRAERDNPPFDRVAMDGIALAGAALAGGRRSFRIGATAAAGTPRASIDSPDQCVEVMTGAVLPEGCDTVVPIERLRVEAGSARLEDGYEPERGQNVHRRATDSRAGDMLLSPGTRLGAPELAIAASAGRAALSVSRQPRIAVISTGDELVEPGTPILDHQLRRSNAYGLVAQLALAGFAPSTCLHLADRPDEMKSAVRDALASHDLLVLSGGVSAGRFDHVPAVLASVGVRKILHRIAQRPGRPMWFGTGASGQAVFALPGNPVSALVCLARYVKAAIGVLLGGPAPPRAMAALSLEFAVKAPFAFFLPVRLRYHEHGRLVAEPRPTKGSGDFVSLAGTDGFVELPPGPATHAAGSAAPFFPW
jgi:molybdopterin molybdotransferase